MGSECILTQIFVSTKNNLVVYNIMVSKWVIITIAAVLVAVSVSIAAIIIILKRMNKEEKVNDEIFLKQKEELLRRAIDQKLDGVSNVVNVESSKILNMVNDGTKKASTSNDLMQKQISSQQKTIENLKRKYTAEMNKIK
ncbi:hypothetical protein PBCVAN69C_367R [Paramecium bursaria Chlorella virus AN69C]|uniref:Uncharacterized protein n=1 Tax=Paramecium bursaria Chlorella virus IL3A TaxID=46019 RepID=M1I5V8_PBCVI|nr:hypothetical protein PBCVAN69C_367R [Paramecium bursaria Chlorella virus AN69C]AGE53875.1 hypothetical protein PBCVIL3A_358R [Paramecium bursaria Chlorella virus IL3A]AGE57308.1 hypothetical protein PBCVNEJV4_374R [Paramecium bursaria Chlorella virus NE-JV-4]